MVRDDRAYSQEVEDTTVCPTDTSFGVVEIFSFWNDNCKNERIMNGSQEGIADIFEVVRMVKKESWGPLTWTSDEKNEKMKSLSVKELRSDHKDKKRHLFVTINEIDNFLLYSWRLDVTVRFETFASNVWSSLSTLMFSVSLWDVVRLSLKIELRSVMCRYEAIDEEVDGSRAHVLHLFVDTSTQLYRHTLNWDDSSCKYIDTCDRSIDRSSYPEAMSSCQFLLSRQWDRTWISKTEHS